MAAGCVGCAVWLRAVCGAVAWCKPWNRAVRCMCHGVELMRVAAGLCVALVQERCAAAVLACVLTGQSGLSRVLCRDMWQGEQVWAVSLGQIHEGAVGGILTGARVMDGEVCAGWRRVYCGGM